MIPIVTIDDNAGVSFNDRRQSRDLVLCQYIVELTKDSVLWMNESSANLFAQLEAPNVKVDNNFLSKANPEDYCFVEKESLDSNTKKVIVCKWNREYPADVYLGLDAHKYKVKVIGEIRGKSHDKITIEEWVL